MDDKWFLYWQMMRDRGRARFVLVRGGTLGVIMAAALVWLPRAIGAVTATNSPWPAMLGFGALGLSFGVGLWLANERTYKRLARAREKTASDHPPAL